MKIFFDEAQTSHNPPSFLVAGQPRPSPEKPERVHRLRAAAETAGHEILAPEACGIWPASLVHTPEYLDFLKVAYEEWSKVDGAAEVIVPNVHPRVRNCEYPTGIVGRAGYHMMDTAAPIGPGTYESVLASLASAVDATKAVMETGGAAYALCRPPGHHAYADAAGGFCFVNNSAVAGQILRDNFGKVVIIDVDLHHGNGTQGIFYERDDVMTVSLHCDPSAFYPFFYGYASERGEGAGLGFNLNVPLARGAGDEAFLTGLATALERITSFGPDAMVVALGLDAFEGDPFGGLSVTTDGFGRIGHALGTFAAEHDLPTVLVQEGGYPCEELGDNLVSTLAGFEGA